MTGGVYSRDRGQRGGLVVVAMAALLAFPASGQPPRATPKALPPSQEKPPAAAALAGAQEALERQDYDTAAMLLESFLFVYPGHSEALFNLAYCYSLQGRTADAIDLYRQTLEVDPSLLPPRFNLGLLLLEAGKPAEAVAEFEEVLDSQPDHARAHLYRGVGLDRLGHKERALEEYRRAAELDPRAAAPRHAALPLLLQKHAWGDAETLVRQLLDITPGDAELTLALAELLVNQDEAEAALAAYSDFLDAHPEGESASPSTLGEIHMRAGWLARKLGRTEEALHHFRGARERGGDYYAQSSAVEEADTLAALKRWKDAIALYEAAVARQPGSAELHAALGYAYLENQQFELAGRELLAALRLDPERIESYNHLASALYLSGALEGAIEVLDRRAARAPETPGTLFLRAISYDKLNQCGPAILYYGKFLAGNVDKESNQYFQASGRLRALKRSCRDRRK